MQGYYCSTFSIQLNNDEKTLQNFKNVYLHIQKSDKQIMFSSIKKRESTSILFYNEEGFIFNKEELLEDKIIVQIHEYLMDSFEMDYEDKDQEQNSDIYFKDSLIGLSSLSLNQQSTSIYSPSNPSVVIGELMYTLKSFIYKKNSETNILQLIPTNLIDERNNNLEAESNIQYNSKRSNIQLSSKYSSIATSLHDTCQGDTNHLSDKTSNNQQLTKSCSNQITNKKDNLIFFKLLNPQNQQQIQNQYNGQNEEESTETPTSKLISSQGDLNSSRQDEQIQTLSKSVSQSLHLNENDHQSIHLNKLSMGQKLKQIFEINSPSCKKNKNSYSENSSPTNKRQNLSNKDNNSQQQQQNSEQQKEKPQNVQQKTSFSQYQIPPSTQQQNNSNNHINVLNKLPIQNLKQYQQSPVYSPVAQQVYANKMISPFQTNISQYANPLSNRIQTSQFQNNMIYQNNQGLTVHQNFNTPQHRFVQQPQPVSFYQPIQNPQIPTHRNSTFASTSLRLTSTPFQVQKRY